MVYESIQKILHPEPVEGMAMIAVAGAAAVINALSAWILSRSELGERLHLHGHAHGREHEHVSGGECDCDHDRESGEQSERSGHGGHKHDLNTRAAILHLASDVGISLCVVAGGFVVKFTGFTLIDPILSLAFAAYILYHAVKIFREAFRSLMDFQTCDLGEIVSAVKSIKGVSSVHDAHLTEPSTREKYFSIHVVVDGKRTVDEFETLAENIRERLKDFGITHSVIQPETSKYEREDILCVKK